MIIRYVIHLQRGYINCFSTSDLEVNVLFSLKEGYRIVGIERVFEVEVAA